MRKEEFEVLFRAKLDEARSIAESTLGRVLPKNVGILRESPKSDGRRISVEEATSELFLSETEFYRIIDLAVVEVSPTTTWVWARESDHQPALFEATWNQPPGSAPFKQLIAEQIRTSMEAL